MEADFAGFAAFAKLLFLHRRHQKLTCRMHNPLEILAVEQDGRDGVIVRFSDGTAAGYVVEELLNLRPKRLPFEIFQPNSVTIPTGTA